jgi:hypothetical protein
MVAVAITLDSSVVTGACAGKHPAH